MSTIERKVTIGLAVLGAVLIVGALICAILIRPVETRRVASKAMEPTLKLNDVVLVEKFSVLGNAPFKRGQVIEFSVLAPDQKSERFVIRRIAGLPGDRIRIDGEHNLFINGKSNGTRVAAAGQLEDTLAGAQILVVADCWDAKLDELPFGVIDEAQCVGLVILKLAPSVEPVK